MGKINSISARLNTFSHSNDGIIIQGDLRCCMLGSKELPQGQLKKQNIAEVGSICALTGHAGQLHS